MPDQENLTELLAFLRSDPDAIAVVAEDLEAEPGRSFFKKGPAGAPTRLSDALAMFVRGEKLPKAVREPAERPSP